MAESDRAPVGRLPYRAEPGTILGPDNAGRLFVVRDDGHTLATATMAELDAAATRAPGSVAEYGVLVGRRPGAQRKIVPPASLGGAGGLSPVRAAQPRSAAEGGIGEGPG